MLGLFILLGLTASSLLLCILYLIFRWIIKDITNIIIIEIKKAFKNDGEV